MLILIPNPKVINPELGDQLDIVKFIMSIHSQIQDMSPDFVMAKFDSHDINLAIEMKQSAFILTNLMARWLQPKVKTRLNTNNHENAKIVPDVTYQKNIMLHVKEVAMIYMLRPQVLANLKRNQPNNPILEYATGISKTLAGQEEDEAKQREFFQSFKDKLGQWDNK